MNTEFDKDEYSFAYPDGIENNYWNVARNKTILQTVRRFKLDHIIDVGCGRGIVTGFLHKNKIGILGVELGSTTAIGNSGANILYDTNATQLPKERAVQFKTITLFDVIEHIEKPVDFIQKLISHFNNADTIVVTVPARKELWTNFDEYYGHYRRYTLGELKNELQSCGFKVKESKYFFHSLYFMIRLSNMINKKRELKFSPPRGVAKVIHKLFGYFLFMEGVLLPGRFLGSSIICVAEKIK